MGRFRQGPPRFPVISIVGKEIAYGTYIFEKTAFYVVKPVILVMRSCAATVAAVFGPSVIPLSIGG